jgi:hypothetical protein
VVALAIWIVMLTTGTAMPSRFDPLSWHIHKMLFGFVIAAFTRFLLTAIPNWTRRLPVSGRPWCCSPVCDCLADWSVWFQRSSVLVAVAAREIIAGRNWHNLPMVVPVTVLGIANLLMHLEAEGAPVPSGLGGSSDWPPSSYWSRSSRAGSCQVSPATDSPNVAPPAFPPVLALSIGSCWISSILGFCGGRSTWRRASWRGTATRAEPLPLILPDRAAPITCLSLSGPCPAEGRPAAHCPHRSPFWLPAKE